MKSLNNKQAINELDKSNVLGSVEALPDQCQQAWEDASKIAVPADYRKVESVVMTGMGGSGLGARLIESIYGLDLTIPLVRVNDYDLPGFVNEKTLVVCSSYSGTTEETIENARQAIAKKAKWMSIGTGGTLIELAKQQGVPYYQIEPTHNPSHQPRMAIGYSVVGQLAIVAKAGLIKVDHSQVSRVISVCRQMQNKLKVEVPEEANLAKQMALQLKDKVVAYVAAGHLTGAVHTVKNQLNENAKTFAARFNVPELNHHLMEGLQHPKSNPDNLAFFLVQSDLYPGPIQKRLALTQDVIGKNKIEVVTWKPESSEPLTQAFELIQFGAYVNFYLSMLYGIDPAPIPWVDYFKEQLKRR